MKSAISFFLSAVFWFGLFAWWGHTDTAIIMLAVHFVAWQCHRIEVKVNRLLGAQGIIVTDAEITS